MTNNIGLTAYVIRPSALSLAVPGVKRKWMDQTDHKFANRCLPLLMANKFGWFIISEHTFKAEWDGDPRVGGITIKVLNGEGPAPVSSHFGSGILTWDLPWLFRTDPGWNLHVRGPANFPITNACPMEGIIETDWSPAPFTVNWLIMKPFEPVFVRAGDPIAMIAPVRRGELESISPVELDISANPKEEARFDQWRKSRQEFAKTLGRQELAAIAEFGEDYKEALQRKEKEGTRQTWQKDYMIGNGCPENGTIRHQRSLRLKDFESGFEA